MGEISHVDRRVCRFPGCDRPAVDPEPGVGRPPEYCDDEEHNRAAAWRARRRLPLDTAPLRAEDENRPVDAAHQRASAIRGQVLGMVELLGQQLNSLVDEIRTISDPEAAEAQIEAITTEAAEQVAASTARASRAEQAQRRAEAEQAEADAAALEATKQADAAQASLEQAEATSGELEQRLAAALADLQAARDHAAEADRQAEAEITRLEEQLAGMTARNENLQAAHERATTAREEATRRAATAQARADSETERAERAEALTQGIRQQLDATREHAAQLATQLAVITAERDTARRDIERERSHADQRVADLRALHEEQVTQLRQDLAHLQTELRARPSRPNRGADQTAEANPTDKLRSQRSGPRQAD